MKKKTKALWAIVVLLIIVLQFFQPKKNKQEITDSHIYNQANLSGEVKTLLQNSCLDCHSNTTNYDWYHHISPVSWYVDNHIKEGKKAVNFSEWGGCTKLEKIGLLDEISEEVEKGKMPLKSYTLIHKNAHLSATEKEAIITWAKNYAEELLVEK